MSYVQVITPEPDIPCKPGWCLEYVNDSFGVNAVYDSATDAWNASTTKHRDQNYPEGLWVPLWFSMITQPLGHVVLRSPDGSIYSTSDNSTIPHHHPSLEHLMSYYSYYGQPLHYLGWTEDVEGTPVIKPTESEDMPLSIGELELIQNFANENGDRVINMLRAEDNARFSALVKLIGEALNVDESKLADALLAKGEIRIEPKSGN